MTRASACTRRRSADWIDRFAIAGSCTLLVALGRFLPGQLDGLSRWLPERLGSEWAQWIERLPANLAGPAPHELPLVLGTFLALLAGLARLDVARLRLTRTLMGLCGSVALLVCLCSLLMWLGVRPLLLPVGLAALFASSSFGAGAGLAVGLASGALLSLTAESPAVAAMLVIRALLVVVLFRQQHRAAHGFAAAVFGAAGAALVLLFMAHTPASIESLRAVGLLGLGGFVEGVAFLATRGLGEQLLGHVSRERLHALLDLNQPLLRRMMERAPGSFEHSRAMANMAEQAASAIGADALLTRVGAYYHDLGKSCDPSYFVENLEPGETSPHHAIAPRESAARIKKHVEEGAAILRSGGIPEPVVEFAYTHHGTQRVEYFLAKQRELVQGRAEEVDEEAFRYPGMRPQSRETAILMLVDSIEAASRTLDSPDPPQIEEMVRRIVFSKLGAGQLDDSGLSMYDLRVACDRVVWTLAAMNHHRIKYPWQKRDEKGKPSSQTRPAEPKSSPARSSPAAQPLPKASNGGVR